MDRDRQVDALTRGSLRWFVVMALIGRVAFTVPAVILNRSVLGELGDRILPLSVGVLLIDAVLIMVVVRRPGLLSMRWLFVADMVLAVIATVGATLLIPPGSYLIPGRDALTGYGWGTVALWTVIRGARTGVALVGLTAAIQLGMAWLNDSALDGYGIAQVVLRVGFALMNFLLAAALTELARRGARHAVSEGLRAGRLAERADALRALHDNALAELDAIVLTASRSSIPPAERLALAVRRARLQASLVRGQDTEASGDVLSTLIRLGTEFSNRGLQVAVCDIRPPGTPQGSREAVAALVGAAREALNNVVKHAGVGAAEVRVTGGASAVEVEVVDHGHGFRPGRNTAGFGVRRSMHERIDEVGGQVRVRSAPGAGTRVTVTIPHGIAARGLGRGAAPPAGALTWFPLVPLISRVLALPLMALMLNPFLPGHLGQLYPSLAVLLAGNIALLAALLRPGAERVLCSPLLLGVDLAAAAGFFLWTAAALPTGIVLQPSPDAGFLYVFLTVAFWLAARGLITGVAVLLGAIGLESAAAGVNGVVFDPANGLLFVQHVVLVGATVGCAALVMRMAGQANRRALAESIAAGRQAERVEVLAGLHRRVLATWDTLAATPTDGDSAQRLAEIRQHAAALTGELRAALRADDPTESSLRRGLEALVRDRAGALRVELVAAELTGDPPPDVARALIDATAATLADFATGSGWRGGSVVIRVAGNPSELEIVVRSPSNHADHAATAAIMAAAGGRVDIRSTPDRGSRTRLQWSAR